MHINNFRFPKNLQAFLNRCMFHGLFVDGSGNFCVSLYVGNFTPSFSENIQSKSFIEKLKGRCPGYILVTSCKHKTVSVDGTAPVFSLFLINKPA